MPLHILSERPRISLGSLSDLPSERSLTALWPLSCRARATEYAFGTIFQQTIANRLGVRLHYGHPDFVDTFWVLNNGGMSKASPDINLSEDAFLGYNNVFDGEKNTHVPYIEWHKGRETEFSAAAGFLFKISGGASAMLRSRDVHRVYADMRMDLLTKMSLFYGSLGNYFSHLVAHLGQVSFLLLFFFLAISGLSAEAVPRAPRARP